MPNDRYSQVARSQTGSCNNALQGARDSVGGNGEGAQRDGHGGDDDVAAVEEDLLQTEGSADPKDGGGYVLTADKEIFSGDVNGQLPGMEQKHQGAAGAQGPGGDLGQSAAQNVQLPHI